MTDRIKYLLDQIEGLNWIAIVTLVFFFVLFLVIIYVAFAGRKEYNDYMAHMPLEENGDNDFKTD